jgi:hypothetical protein
MDFAAFLSSLCGGGPLEAWLSQARILRLGLSPIRIGVSLYPYLGGNRYGSGYYFEAYPFMVLTVISATTTWLAAWRTGPRQAAVVRACFGYLCLLLFSMSLAVLVSGAESSAQTIGIFGNAVPNDPRGSGNAVTLGVKFGVRNLARFRPSGSIVWHLVRLGRRDVYIQQMAVRRWAPRRWRRNQSLFPGVKRLLSLPLYRSRRTRMSQRITHPLGICLLEQWSSKWWDESPANRSGGLGGLRWTPRMRQ